MNLRLKKCALALVVIAVALVLAGPASAQWIAGSKVTIDNIDNNALSADITGTIFYSTGVTFATAFVGVSSGFGTIAPAIDFGDGSALPPYFPGGYGIAFDQTSTPVNAPGPVRAYRMGFSHVYGVEGTFPVTINSHFTGGISPGLVFTGVTTTAPTPSYATFSGIQTFVRNSADAVIGGGPTQPPFDPTIPTASEVGLLALALLLGSAGVFFLRR